MLEPAASGSAVPRAFLRIGGFSVARQQLALALALKCERVICLAQLLSPELVELQLLAENAGAQFHVIARTRPLAGLVTAVDEVIALADGLFASLSDGVRELEQGQAVLVQPIEQGLVAGFERIDLNFAAAGAFRVPGRLVERLAELPADCDAISSLQRLALQAGTRQREISTPRTGGLFWTLVRSEAEAHALEPQWIRHCTRDTQAQGPARGLALLAVRHFGPAMLHAGSGSFALGIAAAVAPLLGLLAGWYNLVSLGLGLCALGWFLRESAVLLGRIEYEVAPKSGALTAAYAWLFDAVLVLLLLWGISPPEGSSLLDRLFPPVMLLFMLRILPCAVQGRWTAWVGDRSMIALILIGSFIAGVSGPAIRLGAVIAALAAILLSRSDSRLTPD